MPATLSTVDPMLKEIYGPRIEEQLQSEVTALKRIERTSDGVTNTVGGKYVDFPIRVRRNHGMGYRGEREALPAAKRQGYAEVHVPLRYGYGRFGLTGQAMKLAEKNPQAFASAADEEMDGLKEGLKKDSGRIAYGDGTGLLASLAEASTDTVHTLDSMQYIEDDMQVDVEVRSSGADVAMDRSLAVTDEDAEEVEFSGAAFLSAITQGVYRQGSRNKEPNGFASIVSATSVLHTVDPADEPKWKSVVMAHPSSPGTARALSEGLMIEMCDRIRTNGGAVSVIFTSMGVRRSYFNLLTQQRRFSNTKEFTGGFSGLPFQYGGKEIPLVDDVDAPPNKAWFLDESTFKVYQESEWHFADDDGDVLKWVRDYDEWEGFMRKYWELGTSRRNANGLLTDIIEG